MIDFSFRNKLYKTPIPLGQVIACWPYSFRPILGAEYRRVTNELRIFNNASVVEKKQFIYKRLYSIVSFALEQIPFYIDFYHSKGFDLSKFKSYDDIHNIPIISKKDLLEYTIEQRSSNKKKKYIVNTGGSSGHTLSFYIEPSSMGHEWGHMHTIWKQLGFHPSDLKLGFVGRSSVKNGVEYDFLRHTLAIDIYNSYAEIAPKLKSLLKKYPCKYLHGYPSTIYEFALYCEIDQELKKILKASLEGAFLSSEYPYSKYRDKIEEVFNIQTISWYGHTERCILAFEKNEKFRYYPFQTYGFTEVAHTENSNEYNLIGTSYYNFASPLIRYNTEDLVNDPVFEEDILQSFKISEGRSGQFIVDKFNKRISLTGLIFGRHHKLFDYCSHIQIKQIEAGSAVILFVLNRGIELDFNPELLFDSSNIAIDFLFEQIIEPIKTVSGKINLLVKSK